MSFRSLIKNPAHTRYDGEDNDEQILYIVRSSVITLIPRMALVAGMLILPLLLTPFVLSFRTEGQLIFSGGYVAVANIFWYLVTFAVIFQSFLGWYFNLYIISNKKIIDMDFRGLMYKNISETTLDNVEDVTSTVKGALGTIFNIGHVYIQTAGELPEFDFLNVDDPSQIRDMISDLVASRKGHGHHHDQHTNN